MYSYQNERARVFTEDGQVQFLKIRDRAQKLIAESGAATLGRLIAHVTGDSWLHIACVDRLVELGELRCVSKDGASQDHVYVRGYGA